MSWTRNGLVMSGDIRSVNENTSYGILRRKQVGKLVDMWAWSSPGPCAKPDLERMQGETLSVVCIVQTCHHHLFSPESGFSVLHCHYGLIFSRSTDQPSPFYSLQQSPDPHNLPRRSHPRNFDREPRSSYPFTFYGPRYSFLPP